MLNQAAIVKDDFIVSTHSKVIYEGEPNFNCNAIMMVFLKPRQSEIVDGTLYANGCPGVNEASLIVVAKIKKAIFSREPETSDELCAIELLKEKGIEIIFNPDIIL